MTKDARYRCLEAAGEAVLARGDAYGSPVAFFAAVAKRWSLTLGVGVQPRQVLLCLLDVKQQRAIGSAKIPDTMVDIAGYAACLAEVDAFFTDNPPESEAAGAATEPAAPVAAAPVRSRHWERVLAFAALMDARLLANDHKGDWREGENAAVAMVDRLRDETKELVHELALWRVEMMPADAGVVREAADVANFAMMIADLFGGGLDAP